MLEEIKQVDEATAIKLYKSGWWNGLSAQKIVSFQLFQARLCMSFSDFHEAVEKALGRPVYTHEFGMGIDEMRREFLGEKAAPTMDEIMALIPEDKWIVFVYEAEVKP